MEPCVDSLGRMALAWISFVLMGWEGGVIEFEVGDGWEVWVFE